MLVLDQLRYRHPGQTAEILAPNGQRIVASGLEPGERIVVNGLQRVRFERRGKRTFWFPPTENLTESVPDEDREVTAAKIKPRMQYEVGETVRVREFAAAAR